jgi:predicted secreted protein
MRIKHPPAQISAESLPPMLVLSQTDNDRTVSVRVGDMVRISLPENASTGYRWTIERYDDGFLEALPAEAGYTSNSVGSGGVRP